MALRYVLDDILSKEDHKGLIDSLVRKPDLTMDSTLTAWNDETPTRPLGYLKSAVKKTCDKAKKTNEDLLWDLARGQCKNWTHEQTDVFVKKHTEREPSDTAVTLKEWKREIEKELGDCASAPLRACQKEVERMRDLKEALELAMQAQRGQKQYQHEWSAQGAQLQNVQQQLHAAQNEKAQIETQLREAKEEAAQANHGQRTCREKLSAALQKNEKRVANVERHAREVGDQAKQAETDKIKIKDELNQAQQELRVAKEREGQAQQDKKACEVRNTELENHVRQAMDQVDQAMRAQTEKDEELRAAQDRESQAQKDTQACREKLREIQQAAKTTRGAGTARSESRSMFPTVGVRLDDSDDSDDSEPEQ